MIHGWTAFGRWMFVSAIYDFAELSVWADICQIAYSMFTSKGDNLPQASYLRYVEATLFVRALVNVRCYSRAIETNKNWTPLLR